ncbi:hypothetical protein CR513_47481, partial [Mucuna pruriens]
MTRSRSSNSLHSFDPKIYKTLNRIRKTKNIHVGHNNNSLYEPELMENNNRTLKELATSDVLYQPWCIQYSHLKPTQSYELKSKLIHLLPKFHGLAGEDPHKHLKEFHDKAAFVLSRWSSKGLAVFAAGHVQHLGRHEVDVPRKVLPGIQNCGHLKMIWRRYMNIGKGSTSCVPRVRTNKSMNNFYCSLLMMDRNMVDATSGGALMDKTPQVAIHLISNMIGELTVGSENIPSQTILNPKGGGVGVVVLHSAPQPNLRPVKPRPNREPTSEYNNRPELSNYHFRPKQSQQGDLLKLFKRVEINIPLLDAIKQVLKYARLLKELCVHKRKKIKGVVETGGIVSALVKHEDVSARVQRIWAKKCQDPSIFSVPCTIDSCTFTDAMLDLGAFINVMPTSVYRLLNFNDLEPTGMEHCATLRRARRCSRLGQRVELSSRFLCVGYGGQSVKEGIRFNFRMTILDDGKHKDWTLSIEFRDTFVKFNIFEALKHPIEDQYFYVPRSVSPICNSIWQGGPIVKSICCSIPLDWSTFLTTLVFLVNTSLPFSMSVLSFSSLDAYDPLDARGPLDAQSLWTPYMELQTSKLDNFGGSRKIRQRVPTQTLSRLSIDSDTNRCDRVRLDSVSDLKQ